MEPGVPQSMGLQKLGHHLVTEQPWQSIAQSLKDLLLAL